MTFFNLFAFEDPPKYLATNLEDFLKPGTVEHLKSMIAKAREDAAAASKDFKGSAKCRPKGKAKGKAKCKSQPTEASQAKELKQIRTKLAQDLVWAMVKYVEDNNLLKDGIYVKNVGASEPAVAPLLNSRFIKEF